MAYRADSRAGRRSFFSVRHPVRRLAVLFLVQWLMAIGSPTAEDRSPERFRDVLGSGSDWDIAVPDLQSPRGFEAAIQAGTALNSTTYLQLDRELRSVLRRLELDPLEADSIAQLEILRERLRQRVAVNLEAGFPYAAGVYIELLRIAGASPAEIRRLTAALQARSG